MRREKQQFGRRRLCKEAQVRPYRDGAYSVPSSGHPGVVRPLHVSQHPPSPQHRPVSPHFATAPSKLPSRLLAVRQTSLPCVWKAAMAAARCVWEPSLPTPLFRVMGLPPAGLQMATQRVRSLGGEREHRPPRHVFGGGRARAGGGGARAAAAVAVGWQPTTLGESQPPRAQLWLPTIAA